MAQSALTTGPVVLNMGGDTDLLPTDSDRRRIITLALVDNRGAGFITARFITVGRQIAQMTVPPGETRLAPVTGLALTYSQLLTVNTTGGAAGDAVATLTYDAFNKSE